MKLSVVTLLVAGALTATACATATQQPPPAAAPPTAAPSRAALPEAIRWVRASAEHRALFLQVYRDASTHVREAAAQRPRGSWAVILDADETILDNSEYQRRRAAEGLGFTQETWDAWGREQKATALPGAVAFLNLIRESGGRIAIVTNRDDYVCPETRRNMEALGLVSDVVLCRAKGLSDKNPRFESVRTGEAIAGAGTLDIVAWVGDNIQDFPRLSQEISKQSEGAFENFGRTYFMLPNPMYGSWERLPVP